MNIPFKDISYAQGNYVMGTNVDQLIAIRMSSGDGGLHFDTRATQNYDAAAAAGKVIIGYHFAGTGDPTAEANFFLEAMRPYAEGDIYALDIEQGQDSGWINTFVEVVHAATGCWPLVYMNISTANALWAQVNSNCGLWLAAPSWGFDQTITELNAGIVYVAQQGPIVNGVDSDMFFAVDLDHVKAYGYKTPTETVPAPEPTPAPAPTTPPTQVETPLVLPDPTPQTPVQPTDPAPELQSTTPTPSVAPPAQSPVKSVAWYVKVLQWFVDLFKTK